MVSRDLYQCDCYTDNFQQPRNLKRKTIDFTQLPFYIKIQLLKCIISLKPLSDKNAFVDEFKILTSIAFFLNTFIFYSLSRKR